MKSFRMFGALLALSFVGLMATAQVSMSGPLEPLAMITESFNFLGVEISALNMGELLFAVAVVAVIAFASMGLWRNRKPSRYVDFVSDCDYGLHNDRGRMPC